MYTVLKILIVEDSENDALQIVLELKKCGYEPYHERVDTAETMRNALRAKEWDAILADYTMRAFSGMAALEVLKASGKDIPFIIVSGKIGEEAAANLMKAGAHDFVMINNLARLVPAIEREIQEAEGRRRRRQAEAALKRSDERYRHLLESVTDYVYSVQLKNGRPVASSHSPGCLAVTGYTPEEFVADPELWYRMIYEDDRPAVLEQAARVLSGENPPLEHRIIHKDSGVRWIRNTPVLRRDQQGCVEAYDGIVSDITERKRAEAALRESENRMSAVVRGSPIPKFVIDSNHLVTHWNEALERYTGIYAEDIIGTNQHWRAFYVCERPCMADLLVDGLLESIPGWYEGKYVTSSLIKGAFEATDFFPHIGQSGTWLSFTASPIRDTDGSIIGAVETLADITNRKQAEEEITWNLTVNQALSSLYFPLVTVGNSIEQIADIILEKCRQLTSSAHGVVAEIDPSTGDLIAHTFSKMMKTECRIAKEELRKTSFSRGADGLYYGLWGHSLNARTPFFINTPGKHPASSGVPEGHIAVERFLAVPVSLGDNLVGQISLANSSRDYTDRDLDAVNRIAEYYALAIQYKRAERERAQLLDQLRQSQKMEAIGLLAGGIAHDFNNLLMAIVSYGGVLQMKMTEDDPLKPNVDKMLNVVDRAAALTQSLLAFSRKQVFNLRPVNLNDIIRKVEKLLARIIGEDIEILTNFREDPLNVNVDIGQIEQVLMNLATNARDAMTHGGLLSILTESTEINDEYIKAHGYGEPGRYARFLVTDTGTGMDATTTRRIFDPFFTTKELGKGTGLGLSVVYGIVKQHGGYINVFSEPGIGTTFQIYLPLLKNSEPAEKDPVLQPRPTGGTETILLAEDDAELRQLVKAILTTFGYAVIEAVDGDDAVGKFSENMGRIQLLLLDIIMPKKSGKDARDEIQKMRSDIRTIFISGYPFDVIQGKGLLEEGCDLIMKPVNPQSLLRKIREVLDM